MQVVSVIIPAYNAADTLPLCLQSLEAQVLPPGVHLEIIVADDCSADQTLRVAQAAGVRCVQTDGPASGASAARNLGVAASSGDPLLFTDADCAPGPHWASSLLKALEDPDVVGAKGTYRTVQPELVARFVQQEYEDKYRHMAASEAIDFIDTYSAAYRRAVFLENGGFDGRLRLIEDQELSFRLARKGYLLRFVPEAVVGHRHVSTLQAYARRKFGIGYWKAVLLRWHPERVFRDSHTHPTQRWQIALLGLAALAAAAVPLLSISGWLAAGSLAAFLLTTVPFLFRILRRDAPVALVAPVLLVARAAGLGLGLMAGFAAPPEISAHPLAVNRPGVRAFKRVIDILGGLIGLAISLPVIIVSAAAIKLTSPGPVFFVQERAGEHGKTFRLFKLRTMEVNAHHRMKDLWGQNSIQGPAFKLPHDPRVTPVGRLLRRWSLDELPQFWNVLRGEMSLVGPRPEETSTVAMYDDLHRRRLVVKPGLTGPMQISGRGSLNMDDRLQLELDYIENYSLLQDLSILIRSIGAVLSGRGAF